MCDDCAWEDFADEGRAILDRIEEVPDRCDAKESWAEKVESMVAWAKENSHVTDRMTTALDTITAGVRRWERE